MFALVQHRMACVHLERQLCTLSEINTTQDAILRITSEVELNHFSSLPCLGPNLPSSG